MDQIERDAAVVKWASEAGVEDRGGAKLRR